LKTCINHGFTKKQNLNELTENPYLSYYYEYDFDPDFITDFGNDRLTTFKNDIVNAFKEGKLDKKKAIHMISSVILEVNYMRFMTKKSDSEYTKITEDWVSVSKLYDSVDNVYKDNVKDRWSSHYRQWLHKIKKDEGKMLNEAIKHAKSNIESDESEGWTINYDSSKKVNASSIKRAVRSRTPTFDENISVWHQETSPVFL
jgi:hypothetical protein